MAPDSFTVTIDLAYPSGVIGVADDSLHRFLDAIEPYRGALNVGRLGHRGMAVTVSIDPSELAESTLRDAATLGEQVVREHLALIAVGDDCRVQSIEVTTDTELGLQFLPSAAIG